MQVMPIVFIWSLVMVMRMDGGRGDYMNEDLIVFSIKILAILRCEAYCIFLSQEAILPWPKL